MNSFNKTTQMTSFRLLVINLHFLFCLLISVTEFPLTCHGCHEQDRSALLDFKSSLEDRANRLVSWQDSYQHQNCCNWYGVGCSYDSFRVISVSLRNTVYENSLTGNFPPSLFRIPHLEYIDLSFNNFQGTQIPLQLSNLTKLSHLDLSHSNIGSPISTQFNNLSSLHYLDLSGNDDLRPSSVKWVRGLVNLQVLNLSDIDLYPFSQEILGEHISHLSNLRDLDLSYCNISSTTFPNFHNLSFLSSLNINSNALNSRIPVQLANLTSLSNLYLSSCGLQGLVPYLPQLKVLVVSYNPSLNPDLTRMFQHQWPKLQKLSISYTNISGSISNAPMLVSLDAAGCSIQGSLPSWIYNLKLLTNLDLSVNNFQGSIPKSMSNLKLLTNLDLSYNNFQGSIPKSMSNLKFLTILRLSDNNFQGSITNSICELISLRELYLGSNNITGTIPSCIWNLHNLSVFDVYNNSIEGSVSLKSLINDLNLTTIYLSSNRFTVDIDQNISLYSKFKLESLFLKSCNLKGLFPTFICKLSHLWNLDLSHNNLTGVIPSCISKLKNLGSFDISNNTLSGKISIEIGKSLSNCISINLAGNQFSGSIPSSICSKSSTDFFQIIDLSNNKFSGVIPNTLGYCKNLVSLNLGSNNLTGNVPNEIEKLESLGFLQLQDNYLDGTLLNFISKLPSLIVLNLANNQFEGSIPTELFGAHYSLRIISLRSNKFNGSIPDEINNLNKLQILDLSHNNFSGHIPKQLRGSWVNLTGVSQSLMNAYDIQLKMVINGIMLQFEKIYTYTTGLDLSWNMLDGNIPTEIGRLSELARLNLSHNYFSGNIPASIGDMSKLASLDLSFNRLSGKIPQSLTSLDSLGVFNLSYNELSGQIPKGIHFSTLGGDGWAFVGNTLLCGEPTKNVCDVEEDDKKENDQENYQEDTNEKLILYSIISLGFILGFWGLFFVMLIKKEKLWFPYWRFIDSIVAVIIRCI